MTRPRSFGRALHAEWTKLRTEAGPAWLLLAAIASRLVGGKVRLLAVPHYYLLVTAATVIALVEVATKGVKPVWERPEGTR